MIQLATDQGHKTGDAPEAAAWRFEEKYADAEVRTVTDGWLLAVVHAGPEQQRILRALKLAASVDGQSATIFIDFKQASDILSMFGGEPGEVTLQLGEGHSGRGLYAHYTEYPEEGAEFLGATDQEAVPVADASEAVEPLTRFCPGCGSVGPVEAKFRDCCPDGSAARMISEKLAAKCRDLFRAALDGALTQLAPAQQEAAEPMFYASAEQAKALRDPHGENERGVYLPLRKTSAGMFTMPLYSAPAPVRQGAEGDGWKLVPIEPTEAMLDAAASASMQHLIDCIYDPDPARQAEVGSEAMVRKTHASRYRTMLAAAPSASPTAGEAP